MSNITLDSVITDIVGVSGREMIEGTIAAVSHPAEAAGAGPPAAPDSKRSAA